MTDAATPSPLARWRAPLVAATMVATLFATIFLAALGDPSPHDVPVAVVGSQNAEVSLQDALDQARPGGFDVRLVTDEDAGEQLREREVYGVLDLLADPVEVRIAAFNGAALNGVVQGSLVTAAALRSPDPVAPPRVVDIHEGDGKPASTFYVVFGMVIAAMAFTVASGALTPLAAVGGARQRIVATVVTSLVVGIAVGLVAWAFEALPGNYVAVAAIAALLMAGLALCVQGLVLLLGSPGLVLSAIFFIMVGNAASGGAVHAVLLPDGWRQLSPLLPTGAGATAIVDVAAFEGASITAPLAVLVAWAVLGVVLVVVGIRRRAASSAPAAA